MFTSVARYSLGFGHLGVKVTNSTEISRLLNNLIIVIRVFCVQFI